MHCPVSLLTIAPGRTPGQVPVPTGAAAGTGISLQGLPPSVQLELDAVAGVAATASAAALQQRPHGHRRSPVTPLPLSVESACARCAG